MYIGWMRKDTKTTSINKEYVLLGEIKQACDNALEKPTNNLEVTSSLMQYSEKDNKIAIYNGKTKEYIYYELAYQSWRQLKFDSVLIQKREID